MEKICWQITVAAFMQPLQYDLRSPVAKDNSIAHAAAAPSNLDAAITMRSAKTELQNTSSSKTGSRRQSEKKTILKHFLKGFLEGKSLAPEWSKSADKSLSQPSCSHSNKYYACSQKRKQHLQSHLHCGNDPTVAKHNGIPSATPPPAPLAIPFTVRERS